MPGLRDTLDAATQEPNRTVGRSREAIVADVWLKDHAPELAALVLDMAGICEHIVTWVDADAPLAIEARALLARLDQLGKEPSDG